ncbi:MAG TPA: hypothetical protein VK968_18035 [Roseimicrobium sp.]|nr:hypothetical protein [Roseimicrobium sp.]
MSDPRLGIIPGERPVRLKGHRPLIDEHITMLRAEFIGRPEVCYLLGCQIVRLRRGVDPQLDWNVFIQLIADYEEVLYKNLNLRWLISICDTYADYGDQNEQLAGVCLSSFVNLIKLSETERLHMVDPMLRPAALMSPKPLWDGMMSYNMPKGDMPRNLFARMDRNLRHAPRIHRLWLEIFSRLKSSDNLLSRLAAHNANFYELKKDLE